jgi:hypothetical protein
MGGEGGLDHRDITLEQQQTEEKLKLRRVMSIGFETRKCGKLYRSGLLGGVIRVHQSNIQYTIPPRPAALHLKMDSWPVRYMRADSS